MAEYLFYFSLIILFYTYIGYPFILYVFSLFLHREVEKKVIYPTVTAIIPVYNEENGIRQKIENCLSFDYPKEKLKIIVASDSSTDRTEEIVKNFKSEQIQFVSLTHRGGKVAAQNHSLQFVNSEIIVFTDVAITTHSNSIKRIVQNFNDPKIGAVSCRDIVSTGDYNSEWEKWYIQYDMLVRKYTSKIGSLIGVTGGFYGVRKEIAVDGWNPAFPPDFNVSLECIKRGLRVIEDPNVKAYYKTSSNAKGEFPRKVRTLNRGMHAFFSNIELLNIFKFKTISLQLISHKLLRWLLPFFLIILFFSNLFIINNSPFTLIAFSIQSIIYIMAIIYFIINNKKKKKYILLLRVSGFFSLMNLAILKAWYEYIQGKRYIMWEPTKR